MKPKALNAKVFGLHEKLRPDVPVGAKDWGSVGVLELSKVKSLAAKRSA